MFILCLQELLDLDRWTLLVQQFREDNFKLHQLHTSSVFTVTLQAGLSALKTPYPFMNNSRFRPYLGQHKYFVLVIYAQKSHLNAHAAVSNDTGGLNFGLRL